MTEVLSSSSSVLPHNSRASLHKEFLRLFGKLGPGSLGRFVHLEVGDFIIEATSPENLFNWHVDQGGYFWRFSTALDQWNSLDYVVFSQQLRSPEFYFEVYLDNIRIYKHRDFSD